MSAPPSSVPLQAADDAVAPVMRAAVARPDGARRAPEVDDAHCAHCGAINPPATRWRATIAGRERAFCCGGCAAVAQTIHAAGLDAFYAARTAALARPEADADDDEWARHEAEANAAGLVRRLPDGGRETSLLLEGLTCGACVWLIESWMARQPGVGSVAVNYATRRARIAWRDGETGLAALLRAIAAIGYRAFPYDPKRREAIAQAERRSLLLRMAVALLGMMQVMMFAVPTYVTIDGVEPSHQRLLDWASLTLALPVLLYAAAPFFRGAWRDLRVRRLGMDVPVALGLAAAFAASAWSTLGGGGPVYYDSVTMFVALLLVARYLELTARQRAGAAIEDVARARPGVAERLVGDGETAETVGASTLSPGDRVLVRPGATVPADGEVVQGRSHVEEAVLTGESWPKAKAPGDAVLAGSVNRDGVLVVSVAAAGEATRLASVLRLVEQAAAERPHLARVADRVAGWFVAGLLVLAALTAVAWSVVDPARAPAVTFALLVVSCPCALSLATPAALSAAAGALGRRQVVLARADAMESLARVTHVAFDKTGTLTEGRVRLVDVKTFGATTRTDAIAIAAALESRSEHPIARAIVGAHRGVPPKATGIRAHVGEGLEGAVDGRRVRIGRPSFVAALAGEAPAALDAFARASPADATLVVLGDECGTLAAFALGDTLRDGAAGLVADLVRAGLVPVLLSGDRGEAVAAVASTLGIADARGDLAPEGKREAIAALQARGAVVAMAGDGVNDAPALAQAQVSVSLGSATPLAQWTADVVILSSDLARLGDAFRAARRTLRIVRENLAWAAAYNAVAIPAAAFGFVTPLVAAVGMSASSIVVVANAMRLARLPKRERA